MDLLPLNWAWGRWVQACEPFKSDFSDRYSLVAVRTCTLLLFKIRPVSQAQVLKFRMPDVGFKPFAPHGETLDFEFPPNFESHARVGVYDKVVPQPSYLLQCSGPWVW